jgi:hypothetical protein
MVRTVVGLVVQIAAVLVLALLLLGLWLRVSGQQAPGFTGEAQRLLFLFMDIGLGVWVVALVVAAIRRRGMPGVVFTLLAAVAGVALNALTVLVVGSVQGSDVGLFLGYAIEAGVAFLLATLVVAPIIHRLVKPPRPVPPPA